MYDIAALKMLENQLTQVFKEHFVEFFVSHDYKSNTEAGLIFDVSRLEDLERIPYGTGLYVIFSDYQATINPCGLVVDGLKAIYRGHCYTMKKRLMSHLLNEHYRATLSPKEVSYDVCMKLDENNGITITQPPYSAHRWRVVTHKMPGSSKLIREQAELAFDQVFGRPLGSKELAAGDA